jgi:hypothetical protein
LSRTVPLPAPTLRRLRALVALACAALVSWTAAVASLHAAREGVAVGLDRALTATIQRGCPDDCPDPHHHHALHDHASCPTCQNLGRPALREQRTLVVRLVADRGRVLETALPAAQHVATSCCAPRGPPAA